MTTTAQQLVQFKCLLFESEMNSDEWTTFIIAITTIPSVKWNICFVLKSINKWNVKDLFVLITLDFSGNVTTFSSVTDWLNGIHVSFFCFIYNLVFKWSILNSVNTNTNTCTWFNALGSWIQWFILINDILKLTNQGNRKWLMLILAIRNSIILTKYHFNGWVYFNDFVLTFIHNFIIIQISVYWCTTTLKTNLNKQ